MLDRLSLPLRTTLEVGLVWLDRLPPDEQRPVADGLARVLNCAVRGDCTPADLAERLETIEAVTMVRRACREAVEKRRTSLEESGHSVAACVHGLRFERVSIGSDDVDSVGRVFFANGQLRPIWSEAQARRVAIMQLAGPEATRSAQGPSVESMERHTALADDALALAPELTQWSVQARGNLRATCHQLARDLVSEHRRWIERVAEQLMTGIVLTEADVYAASAEPLNRAVA